MRHNKSTLLTKEAIMFTTTTTTTTTTPKYEEVKGTNSLQSQSIPFPLFALPTELFDPTDLFDFTLSYLTPFAVITIMPLVSTYAKSVVERKYTFIPKEDKRVGESKYKYAQGLKPVDKGREMFSYYFPKNALRDFNINWSYEYKRYNKNVYYTLHGDEVLLFKEIKENNHIKVKELLDEFKKNPLSAFSLTDCSGCSIIEYAAKSQELLNYFYHFICEQEQFEFKKFPARIQDRQGTECYSAYIYQRTQLYWAIKCRQPFDTIKELLKKHFLDQYFLRTAIMQQKGCIITPFHLAVSEGNLELVRYLVEMGFRSDGLHLERDIEPTIPEGYTQVSSKSPLFYAMQNNDIAIFKFLVEGANADLSEVQDLFRDMICYDRLPLVEYVLKNTRVIDSKAINVNAQFVGTPLIQVAYQNGHLNIGDVLFSNGANSISKTILIGNGIKFAFDEHNKKALENYLKRTPGLFIHFLKETFGEFASTASFFAILIKEKKRLEKDLSNRSIWMQKSIGLIIELLTEQPTFNPDLSDAKEHPLLLALELKQWDVAHVLLNARVILNDDILHQIDSMCLIKLSSMLETIEMKDSLLKEQVKLIKILLKNYPYLFDETRKSFLKVATESDEMVEYTAGAKKCISLLQDPLESVFESLNEKVEKQGNIWNIGVRYKEKRPIQDIFARLFKAVIPQEEKKLLPILIKAIEQNQPSVVKAIINKYPGMLTQSLSDKPSDIPLVLAAKANQREIANLLKDEMKKNEMKPHEINRAYVALLNSLSEQDKPSLTMLNLIPAFIDAKADINQVNSSGQTPLILAIKCDCLYVVKVCLQENPDMLFMPTVWKSGNTVAKNPLYWVLEKGVHYHILVALLINASERAIEALGDVDKRSDKFIKLANAVSKLAECKLLDENIVRSLYADDTLISNVNFLAEKNNLNDESLSRFYQRTVSKEDYVRIAISQAINRYLSENKKGDSIARAGLLKDELHNNRNNLLAMYDTISDFLSTGQIGHKPAGFFGGPRPSKKLRALVAKAVSNLDIPRDFELQQLKEKANECLGSKNPTFEPKMPLLKHSF
jgi:ankyrin repeat protein